MVEMFLCIIEIFLFHFLDGSNWPKCYDKNMGAKSIKENMWGKNENIVRIHLLFNAMVVIT
jgi:hypothetical protein